MIRATPADGPLVLDLLCAAFEDNKSVNAAVRQDRRRLQRIRGLMEYSYKQCRSFGEVLLSDNGHACVLLLYPDRRRTTLETIVWDLRLASRVIGINRVASVLKKEFLVKANHPKKPFAYLWFIGVDPAVQGMGVGSALLQEVVANCRRMGRPVYLETSVERNLPFYKMFGFEIFKTLELGYSLYLLRLIY